jgi:hypothetical protein
MKAAGNSGRFTHRARPVSPTSTSRSFSRLANLGAVLVVDETEPGDDQIGRFCFTSHPVVTSAAGAPEADAAHM